MGQIDRLSLDGRYILARTALAVAVGMASLSGGSAFRPSEARAEEAADGQNSEQTLGNSEPQIAAKGPLLSELRAAAPSLSPIFPDSSNGENLIKPEGCITGQGSVNFTPAFLEITNSGSCSDKIPGVGTGATIDGYNFRNGRLEFDFESLGGEFRVWDIPGSLYWQITRNDIRLIQTANGKFSGVGQAAQVSIDGLRKIGVETSGDGTTRTILVDGNPVKSENVPGVTDTVSKRFVQVDGISRISNPQFFSDDSERASTPIVVSRPPAAEVGRAAPVEPPLGLLWQNPATSGPRIFNGASCAGENFDTDAIKCGTNIQNFGVNQQIVLTFEVSEMNPGHPLKWTIYRWDGSEYKPTNNVVTTALTELGANKRHFSAYSRFSSAGAWMYVFENGVGEQVKIALQTR